MMAEGHEHTSLIKNFPHLVSDLLFHIVPALNTGIGPWLLWNLLERLESTRWSTYPFSWRWPHWQHLSIPLVDLLPIQVNILTHTPSVNPLDQWPWLPLIILCSSLDPPLEWFIIILCPQHEPHTWACTCMQGMYSWAANLYLASQELPSHIFQSCFEEIDRHHMKYWIDKANISDRHSIQAGKRSFYVLNWSHLLSGGQRVS